MEQRTRVGNRLLAALPTADLDLLVRHFRLVELERDAVLVRSGDPTERLYFPLSGLIAFIMDMPNGQTVATAIVGNEGAVGVLSTLGPTRSPMTAVVRVAGLALQISPTRFHAALGRSMALNGAVQTLNRSLMAQFQHVAACNALHSVEARLARWLLQVRDRADGDVLPLTQETLAEFLGVRRTTVTQVISKLRDSGAIRSNARSSIEIDRPRLEAAACECYQLMRRRIDRIVSDGGEEVATAWVRNPPVCQRGRSAAAHDDAGSDRPTATGPLTDCSGSTALRRLQGECGLAHAPFLFRLMNPGLPGKPFVIGLADRAKGAREKHRAGSKPLPVDFHACRDSLPGPGAFDHDHTHSVPPVAGFFLC